LRYYMERLTNIHPHGGCISAIPELLSSDIDTITDGDTIEKRHKVLVFDRNLGDCLTLWVS